MTRAPSSDRNLPGVTRRVNAERVVLLGWPRAILLQLAHPLIAAGVHEHSGFRASPLAAAQRLHQTVRAMLALTFGNAAEYDEAIAGIRRVHDRVHGVLREPCGRFAAGTPYTAHDPALLLWVHATVVESNLLAYESLVAPLTAGDRDAYCREAAGAAIDLGATPGTVPTHWEAMRDYLESVLASDLLAVGPDARTVAAAVLNGPLPGGMWTSQHLTRPLTAAWLPPAMRQAYGLAWSSRIAARAESRTRLIRRVRHRLPARLACWPDAFRSAKQQASDAIADRQPR